MGDNRNDNKRYGRKMVNVQKNTDEKRRPSSGVVITGGKPKWWNRIINVPSENKLIDPETVERERVLREKREASWNRGIVRIRTGIDRPLLIIILILLVLGTIMVFSASYPLALYETKGSVAGADSLRYIKRQILFAGMGLCAMVFMANVPYTWIKKFSPVLYGGALFLLVLALFIGHGGGASSTEAGVRRWIGIKGTSFNIQPSELMKPALAMMLAWFMEKFRDPIISRGDKKTYILSGIIGPFAIMGIACGAVLMGKHLSGTLIVAAIGVCIIFLGGSHIGYTVLTTVIGMAVAVSGYVLMNPYALKRLTTFADKSPDILSDKWQTTQGLYAIGSGGLLGTGLGGSNQKFSYVSDAHTDFIFTIWCEEMGFIGAVIVIALFLLFIWRGFKVAAHAPDTYGCLLALGIVLQVGIQAFFNIGVVTDVLPNTGVPLPFFSYGGSSLLVLMAEMGILLSISKHSYQKRL